MRKVIDTSDLGWENSDALKSMLNVLWLPRIIIIETIDEDE